MPQSNRRTLLFGGALLVAGMAPAATAQELVPVPSSGFIELTGYECIAYVGDLCYYFGYTSFVLFGDIPGVGNPVADVAALGRLFSVESTPTRFALASPPIPPGRPDDLVELNRAYIYAEFALSDDAVIEYDLSGLLSDSGPFSVRFGG